MTSDSDYVSMTPAEVEEMHKMLGVSKQYQISHEEVNDEKRRKKILEDVIRKLEGIEQDATTLKQLVTGLAVAIIVTVGLVLKKARQVDDHLKEEKQAHQALEDRLKEEKQAREVLHARLQEEMKGLWPMVRTFLRNGYRLLKGKSQVTSQRLRAMFSSGTHILLWCREWLGNVRQTVVSGDVSRHIHGVWKSALSSIRTVHLPSLVKRATQVVEQVHLSPKAASLVLAALAVACITFMRNRKRILNTLSAYVRPLLAKGTQKKIRRISD